MSEAQNQTENSTSPVSKVINNLNPIKAVIETVKTVKDFIEDKEVDQFWDCLPSEAENEKKLAKERKDNGDTFYPSYDEYISTIDEAKKSNCHFTVKAKTHNFSKWGWCCCCENKNN